MRVIELVEYVSKTLPRDELTQEVAEKIWRKFEKQISIEPPSFQTGYNWQLTARGYVGFLPIDEELTLAIRPKVPLKSLFGMLEYAYQLDFKLFAGVVDCATLEEFYERLANVLAKRVIDRQRRGLHRRYVPINERVGYVRGKLRLEARIRRPWDTHLDCEYEEHTAQIDDNEIVGWALRGIAQGNVCSKRVQPNVRRAHRGMSGLNNAPHTGRSCTGRSYNRLNADYEVLHALCRFFLDKSGPEYQVGDHSMLPFLIDMNKLFEQFVAQWLRTHLKLTHSLQIQANVALSETDNLKFVIDLVIKDVQTEEIICVLDTKYKRPEKPSSDDIAQATAYAVSKGCREAILVYPAAYTASIDTHVGNVHVRSLTFSLDGDLEAAGCAFLDQALLETEPVAGTG